MPWPETTYPPGPARRSAAAAKEFSHLLVRIASGMDADATDPHADEPWFQMVAAIEPEHRVVLDEALKLAGRLLPDASACGRYEAIAQEYLGEFPGEADEVCEGPAQDGVGSWRDDARLLGGAFRRSGLRAELVEARAARLEAETDAWTHLSPATDLAAPDVDFAAMTSAQEIDRELPRRPSSPPRCSGPRR